MSFLARTVTPLLIALAAVTPLKAGSLDVRIGYLQWLPDQGPVLSNVIPEPEDAGLRGAELAINDNSTTGKFLGKPTPCRVMWRIRKRRPLRPLMPCARTGWICLS